MKAMRNIWISFFTILLTGVFAFGQVKNSNSRLNIGAEAKPAVKTTGVSGTLAVVDKKVPSEIHVNKNAAINEFYKELLLNNKSKNVTPKSTVYSVGEHKSDDHLFESEGISVSNIYPNPAHEYANLNYKLYDQNKEVKVSFINILGGVVADQALDASDTRLQVSTRNWDNGIYFYQLMVDGKKMATKKLVVRHQ